jgi:hypothetical protein
MALEEFNHFFKSDIDKSFEVIKRNMKYMGEYCDTELKSGYNSIELNIKSNDDSIKRDLCNAIRTIVSAMFSVNDYNSYMKIRHEFDNIFSPLYPYIQKRVIFIKNLDTKHVHISFGEREGKRIHLKQDERLFHASKKSGLTILKPSFKSSRDQVLYPSQRIYFCLNYPSATDGRFWDKTGFVYEYIPNTEIQLFRDMEFSRIHGPCFMVTDSPIQVKNVTNEILEKYSIMKDNYRKENY